MGRCNGGGDLQEQGHHLSRIQCVLFAPGIDVHALDQRHGQPRRAVFGNAGVDQADDMRMGETREDVGLAAKLFRTIAAEAGDGQQLERDCLVGNTVDAARPIDHRHAAATELVLDFPDAQASSAQ